MGHADDKGVNGPNPACSVGLSDEVVWSSATLFNERLLYSFKVWSDVIHDFGILDVEINTEIDCRAGRLANIVVRITIGSTTGGDAVYINDGGSVYGVTVAATGFIRMWRSPYAGGDWTQQ